MDEILNIYKPVGFTPLQTIKKFIEKNPQFKNIKMTYAGRLDPMAEGVLLVLSGNKIFENKNFSKMDKVYEAEILFGHYSDTFDILGIANIAPKLKVTEEEIEDEIIKLTGRFSFELPPYSSYRIKGKPLFQWARKNKLDEIEIPKREVEIFSSKFISLKKINSQDLHKLILNKINLVNGDFRQDEIKEKWSELLHRNLEDVLVVKIKIHCESGTYIRSIADKIGKRLKSGAVLLSLKRTQIGDFFIEDSIII